jgi:sodium-dependent dicarboxylate transporter 2/3/5
MNNLGLDKKLSLIILNFPFVKGNTKRVIIASYVLTAWFSMWISNTATVAMMIPIFMGILGQIEIPDAKHRSTLLLGLAYSGSIGGLGTPIGSPPNILAITFLKELHGVEISFFDWFLRGFPLVAIFIFILIFYIFKKININKNLPKFLPLPEERVKSPFKLSEVFLIILFSCTIVGWFTPGIITLLGLEQQLPFLATLSTEVIGLFFASLLFIVPTTQNAILQTSDIKNVDWSTLLLFGSGIALGKLLFESGLAGIAANSLETLMSGDSALLLLLLLYITIFATELASNTATANILIPIMIAFYLKTGIDPVNPIMGIALACSLAFMLPVGTPPNAIVFGTNQVNLKEMIKTGFLLNIIYGFLLFLVLTVF